MKEISVSLLSADFANLEREIRICEAGGADYLHMDVMDGRFVPNITFGGAVTKAAARVSSLPLDVHLMIAEPDLRIEDFVTDTTRYIVVHQEACLHLERTLRFIKSLGVGCGVALNPATHPSTLDYVLDVADQILVMTVNPGFGAQKFIASAVEKVRVFDKLRAERGYAYKIAVDGGVNLSTIAGVSAAGADILIAGSAVFGADEPAAMIGMLKEAADANAR
ncbi:MAG: ribulose-phosphate 3-epimerase [Clostridiales Family XIII bacterium]|jgi:ribulose-phosphate 3-epimerase|nr:ribulose-phosphate 3-epimerase [Clostridiales Family XIII bacterium]